MTLEARQDWYVGGRDFHPGDIVTGDGRIIAEVTSLDDSALLASAPIFLMALEAISKMPCLTVLLGEDNPDDPCGCASCIANKALFKWKTLMILTTAIHVEGVEKE